MAIENNLIGDMHFETSNNDFALENTLKNMLSLFLPS